jgi:ATP-dependent Lon protease
MEKELKRLIEKAQIKDYKNLTNEDIIRITELQSKNELSKSQIEALIKVTPEFVKMQIEVVKSFAEMSKNIKDVQVKALDPIIESIKSLSKVLEIIATNASSDEVQIKVLETSEKIADKYEKILEINRKQQKNNNRTWTIMGTAFVTLAGAATAYFIGNREK